MSGGTGGIGEIGEKVRTIGKSSIQNTSLTDERETPAGHHPRQRIARHRPVAKLRRRKIVC